jgi:catechol-2,3-dioxygenase
MPEATSSRPQVNGILETSLYVERPTRSVEFYRRVFGFEPIDLDQKEGITDQTRLCAMRAGDRSILLLFKKGTTADIDATGAIHIAFGIARSELPAWEAWLSQQGIPIEFRKTWKYCGEGALLPRPRWSSAGGGHTGCMEHLLTPVSRITVETSRLTH